MSANAETHALLERMFAGFNQHNSDTVVNCMTRDCVFETAAGAEAYGSRFVGGDAVGAAFDAVWLRLPDVKWDAVLHAISADGASAVTTWTFKATNPDRSRVEVEGCDLFTLRDGLVASKRAFRKDRPALPPLGD